MIAALLLLAGAARADQTVIAVGKALTLRAPPGTTFRAGASDSTAGLLAGPGFSLSLDFGPYADPLDRPDFGPPLRVEPVTIDGRPGRLFLWRAPPSGPPLRVGLHVPAVAPGVLGPIRLTIAGLVAGEDTAEQVAAMFRSIRFLPSN